MPGLSQRSPARILCAVLLLSARGFGDHVVPSDDVTSGVIVRVNPATESAIVGTLRPGEQAELLGSVPRWYQVELANGLTGFVSKRWTRIVDGATPSGTSAVYTMDVVDVGTGLAVLVRGPDFALVYDGGSNDDQAVGAGNRLSAYMRAVTPALTAVDHLILSHPHTDHVLLLSDLFQQYQVRHVWDSGRFHDVCGYRLFIAAVRDEPGVEYHNVLQHNAPRDFPFEKKRCNGSDLSAETIRVTTSSRIVTDSPIALGATASMTILHANGASFDNPNRNSVVVRLDLGITRVLLMGDAEAGEREPPSVAPKGTSIEGNLLACCRADLGAHVMVVGHHGSMTSSRQEFLNAVGASNFIVSSGPEKYRGKTLPDSIVITELQSRGNVFRTDQNDSECRTKSAKIGPDNDKKVGGCTNIRVVMSDSASPQVSVMSTPD